MRHEGNTHERTFQFTMGLLQQCRLRIQAIQKRRTGSVVAAVAMLLLAGSAFAGGTLHVPNDFSTIQDAINAAHSGDEIVVAPGTYNEAIDLLGKAVHLQSSDGPEETILDGNGLQSSILTCDSGEGPNTIIEGFTITGGTGNEVEGVTAGGGIFIWESSPSILNCTFTDNTATVGGGILLVMADASVIGCTFNNNAASEGGGIYAIFSEPTVENCLFKENDADMGGAIHNDEASATITNCTFEGNTAQSGGAITNFLNSDAVMTGCEFVGNTANFGGAIMNDGSSPVLQDCHFTENVASNDAGAYYESSTAGTHLIDCTFQANVARTGNGGGILTKIGPDLQIENTMFCENSPADIVGEWEDLGCTIFLDDCDDDPTVPGDLTGDCSVGTEDLLVLLSEWGGCDDCNDCPADLTGDCTVGIQDMIFLLSNWGSGQ